MEEYAKEQVLKKEDGTIAYTLDGKLHSWDHGALVFPKALKQKRRILYLWYSLYKRTMGRNEKKIEKVFLFYKQSGTKMRN